MRAVIDGLDSRLACDEMFRSQSAGKLACMSSRIAISDFIKLSRTDIHSFSITHELNKPQVIGIHCMTAEI